MIFSYELWIAYRYLRARREDGFISIVSWFSLIGISLGVATLIIVMSVMNGFREELLSRIIGLNGHASLYLSEDSKKINSNNIEYLTDLGLVTVDDDRLSVNSSGRIVLNQIINKLSDTFY